MPANVWTDTIAPFILRELAMEGETALGTDETVIWLPLANEFMGQISRECKCYAKEYATASLAVTSGRVAIPTDCMEVLNVYWDGDEVYMRSREWLNVNCPGWSAETETGEPDYVFQEGAELVFYPKIAASTLLTVAAYAILPVLPGTSPDPMTLIPLDFRLLPGRYVLANLPFDPEHADATARQARAQNFLDHPIHGVQGLVDALRQRNLAPMVI